jgi:hypothetical protein
LPRPAKLFGETAFFQELLFQLAKLPVEQVKPHG